MRINENETFQRIKKLLTILSPAMEWDNEGVWAYILGHSAGTIIPYLEKEIRSRHKTSEE